MTCWAVSVVRYEQIYAMSGCLERNERQRVALISALHILRKFAEACRSGILHQTDHTCRQVLWPSALASNTYDVKLISNPLQEARSGRPINAKMSETVDSETHSALVCRPRWIERATSLKVEITAGPEC
jgi:hypothetical protein